MGAMLRILTAMIVTAAAVVFGAQNWSSVPVNLIFGAPTRVRLVFLLLMAAGLGYIVAFLQGTSREVRLRRENRILKKLVGSLEGSRTSAPVIDVLPDPEMPTPSSPDRRQLRRSP